MFKDYLKWRVQGTELSDQKLCQFSIFKKPEDAYFYIDMFQNCLAKEIWQKKVVSLVYFKKHSVGNRPKQTMYVQKSYPFLDFGLSVPMLILEG